LQPLKNGILAQLVEQRTENPCVPGSIPGDTTKLSRNSFINNDLRVFWFLELLERLLGRYKKITVDWLYYTPKVKLLMT
jgi:hypothetical protein